MITSDCKWPDLTMLCASGQRIGVVVEGNRVRLIVDSEYFHPELSAEDVLRLITLLAHAGFDLLKAQAAPVDGGGRDETEDRYETEPNGEGLPERLREARSALGQTMRGMALVIGCGQRSWQDYERGENVPGGKVFARLSRLGFDANWLLTGRGSMRSGSEHVAIGQAPIGRTDFRSIATVIEEKRAELQSSITESMYAAIRREILFGTQDGRERQRAYEARIACEESAMTELLRELGGIATEAIRASWLDNKKVLAARWGDVLHERAAKKKEKALAALFAHVNLDAHALHSAAQGHEPAITASLRILFGDEAAGVFHRLFGGR